MRLPLPRYTPRADWHPKDLRAPANDASVRVRWLGTAGHVVQTATTTLLLDPFLTRPSIARTLLRPLAPRANDWWHHLPAKVDGVLVGHSHYDHLLDAPEIARRTGAVLAGSRSTVRIGAAHGVAVEKLVEVPPEGRTFTVGDITVRFVPSLHGRIALNRVPFPGEIEPYPALPRRMWHYRMGGAYGVHLTTADGRTLYHNGSADLIDAQLDGLTADVLLVGLAGRRDTKGYLERLSKLLKPRAVIPTHFDTFFSPLEEGLTLIPGIDLAGFAREIAEHAPGARVLVPDYRVTAYVPAHRGDDARDAVFVA